MSVTGILVIWEEIKIAYRKIFRPFISWSSKDARKREEKRHNKPPETPSVMLAFLVCLLVSLVYGCATYDHAVIWLDDVLPKQRTSTTTTTANP